MHTVAIYHIVVLEICLICTLALVLYYNIKASIVGKDGLTQLVIDECIYSFQL